MNERREGERRLVWFPVHLSSDRVATALAVTRDASRTGVLISARRKLEPGAEIDLAIDVPEAAPTAEPITIRAKGKVVRIEANQADPDGLWPYHLAVEFDEPQPELERTLETVPPPPHLDRTESEDG